MDARYNCGKSQIVPVAMTGSIDRIFLKMLGSEQKAAPLIVCFYTGDMPRACAKMLRDPLPPIGTTFDERFGSVVIDAISINSAIHDGAVMVGRPRPAESYRVQGWSYRLFPPELPCALFPNRGSAFNSCLAMSRIARVDALYTLNATGLWRFTYGAAEQLS